MDWHLDRRIRNWFWYGNDCYEFTIMILRPYQHRAVTKAEKALKKKGNTLLVASTGAGKTVMLADLAGRIKGKTLVLQHRAELVDQNSRKFKQVNPSWSTSFFTAEQKSFGGQATFAMQQTLCRNLGHLPRFDHVIVDECFPAGTVVSPGIPIEQIKVGDSVDAFCPETKTFHRKQVTHVFKNEFKKTLVKITSASYNMMCTPNHPVLTKRGWVEAQNIIGGDYVYRELFLVREGCGNKNKITKNSIQWQGENLLRPGMFRGIQGYAVKDNYGRNKPKVCFRTNEEKQPYAQTRNKGLCFKTTKRIKVEAASTRWKRDWTNNTATNIARCYTRIIAGIQRKNRTNEIAGVCGALQNRPCVASDDVGYRGGREKSQFNKTQGTGCKERRLFGWQRVDSVEIYQQADIERSARMRGIDYVYNIEVEGLHTYVADGFVVHNCHHIVAPTYQAIIDACMDRNPDLLLSGFTATPERGDKKSLRRYFNNVADKITIKELVSMGFLVPPRAFVVNVGAQEELSKLKNLSAFGDQSEVARVLDTKVINGEVVRHWKEKAHDRQTIIFCATVEHARDVADAFRSAGVACGVVSGDTADCDRKRILSDFDKGKLQVITNVAVLTEGYDSQPVSCVILLRQCSEKGPMIQMAGRGLRTVDPELYPGVVKRDCLILDFGTSLMTHGNLDQEDGLHEEKGEKEKGEAITKICPESYEPGMSYHFPDTNGNTGCGCELPVQTRTCPMCGFVFSRIDGDHSEVTQVDLTELDILNASPFRWVDLFGTDTCLMATGFSAWAGVFSPDRGETWHALGSTREDKKVHRLAVTGRLPAMAAADDMLRNFEADSAAKKSKRWLNDPATTKQVELLNKFGYGVLSDLLGNSQFTKYSAACHLNFCFNRMEIERALGVI